MRTKDLKYLLLALAIAVSGIAVYGTGLYVKYGLLRPAGQDDGVTVIAAPFVYISDEGVRAEVKAYREGSPSPETPGGAASVPATGGSSGEQSPSPSSSADPSPATPPASSKPAVTFPPAGEAVDYSLPPVPDLPPVDDSWYEGALFIGDFRAEELKAYAAKPGASYYCAVSMSVFNYTTERIYKTAGDEWGGKPLEQVLSERQYSKIIINLGLNECGYSLARLQEKYTEFVGMVRSKQPGAAIICMAILTVSRGETAKKPSVSPGNIFNVNQKAIAPQASLGNVYYIDVNAGFADAEGYLPDGISTDGVHFNAKTCGEWMGYIDRAIAALHIP